MMGRREGIRFEKCHKADCKAGQPNEQWGSIQALHHSSRDGKQCRFTDSILIHKTDSFGL